MAKKKRSTPAGERDAPTATPPPPVARPPPDPKFVWPPFPTPPDGVTIIPFSQFQPKGIKVSFDDEPEKDGEGLDTIPLLVKHGLLSGHRKSKNKKKKNPLAEISEEELKKMTWDKRWELGEELRTAKPLDQYEPLVDRFVESTRLFHNGRPWDRPRQELWDQFRLYAGVISGVKRPHSKKKSRFVDDDEGPEGPQSDPEDEISDEDLMAVDGDPVTVSDEEPNKQDTEEEKQNARNEEAYQQLLAAREERPHFWVQETEKAVKVFLSQHFRDKGLMWIEPNARDMPIIIRFYLEFVLTHKLFVEKDFNRGYEKALAIAKRAELDLPATFRMSRALPDEWGLACKSFWGQLYYTPFEEYFHNQSKNSALVDAEKPADGGDRSETLVDDADQPKLVTVDYDLGEKQIKEEAPKILPPLEATIPEEATVEEVDEGAPTAEAVKLPTFTVEDEVAPETEDANQEADNGGWGPSSNNVSTTDLACEWGLPKGNPEEEEDVWGTFVEPTLFAFIGPSEFPVRRIPIRVERSTRVLVAILPPDPASTSIVASRLATLVLQPWPTPNDDPDSLVTSPQMVDFWKGDQEKQDLKAESVKIAREFDPTKDEIRVHVAPEVVDQCRLGMGIGAIWVQIGRRADLGDVSKPNKRKKYPGDDWWYMERLEFVIPSYWTVNDAHRDMTRAGNNPEHAYDNSD